MQKQNGQERLLLARHERKRTPVLQNFERAQDPKLESPGRRHVI